MGLTEQSEKKKSALSFDLTSIHILHHHTTGDGDDTAILALFFLSTNHPDSGQDQDYYLFISVITPPTRTVMRGKVPERITQQLVHTSNNL